MKLLLDSPYFVYIDKTKINTINDKIEKNIEQINKRIETIENFIDNSQIKFLNSSEISHKNINLKEELIQDLKMIKMR